MICPPCALGADLRTGRVTVGGPGLDDLPTTAAELHGRCTGCDCQHGGIVIGFDPGAPGNDLDAMPGPPALRGAVTLQPAAGHPLTVHVDDRTGSVTGVTLDDNVLPYAVQSSPATGPGSLDGATIHRVDMICT